MTVEETVTPEVEENTEVEGEEIVEEEVVEEEVDVEALKAEAEKWKSEANKLKNKIKYKTMSKPKTEKKVVSEDVDVESLVEKKFEEQAFKQANPDIDFKEHKAFAEEKGLSLEDALILKEGYKQKDPAYVAQKEVDKTGMHGTFKKAKTETKSPFAE